MKKIGAIFFTLLFLAFSGASALFLELTLYAEKPAGAGAVEKRLTIYPGETFHSMLKKLHRMEIVKNRWKFMLLARLWRFDKKIKSGEYILSPAMSPNELLDVLIRGKVQLHRLTVPEGYNIYQIAVLVARSGWGTAADFLKAATDASMAKGMGIEADSFEGYLFPDTYFFPREIRPKQMIAAMLKRFWSVFTSAWIEQASRLGLSVHQIVTLASIIEKETGAPEERPVISSVFHNRLKERMRLESDPTVIYGIKDFDGNITRKHLATFTPYNTYRIQGLPPGPIANPGLQSLKAALYPADTKYLYFVSKKDRTHRFSTNLKDHRKAVIKFQLKKRK